MQQEYPLPQAYRNRQYLKDIETDSPILRATADVAIAGHEGQPRGKADADLPYIVHPIMVYHLLKAMGETDEIMLAAALLHDVKEDNKTFRQDHSAFENALADAMKKQGVTDACKIAHEIGKLCAELTNPEKMEEGKRLYQMKHAGCLSLRAAKIKLLDQTASVLDFIMQENEPGFTHDQVASWNFKALNLVKKIAQERPQLGMWRNLHKALFSYAMRIVNSSSPEEAETIRQEFN